MGGGWVLVRRSFNRWSNATDLCFKDLNETSIYGTYIPLVSLSKIIH